jgi:hypothetical protein
MTRVIHALGWIALGVAAILALLGLATCGRRLCIVEHKSGILRTMTSMITCVAIMAS